MMKNSNKISIAVLIALCNAMASAAEPPGSDLLKNALEQAHKELVADPDNPQKLDNYKNLLSEYNLYRNAQSNTMKTDKSTE